MNPTGKSLLFLVTTALLLSCGSSGDDVDTDGESGAVDTASMKQRLNTQIVFYNIPSPVETVELLKDAGAEYDAAMTNDPMSLKNYATEDARAVNLGVYGADLSFAGVFENTQESMSFLKCVNKLSKDLGITESFDEKTMDRVDRNRDNRDSVLDIISKSFWEADSYLKENGRQSVSSLVVAGAWTEGMYIASQIYNKSKEDRIKQRILSDPQRNSIASLVSLMETTKLSNETMFILDGVKKIKAAYDKIPAGNPVTITVTDTAHHETYVETKNDRKVDESTVTEISKAVEELRNKMIGMK